MADKIWKVLKITTVIYPCHCWCSIPGICTDYCSVSQLCDICSFRYKLLSTHNVAAQNSHGCYQEIGPIGHPYFGSLIPLPPSFTWIRNHWPLTSDCFQINAAMRRARLACWTMHALLVGWSQGITDCVWRVDSWLHWLSLNCSFCYTLILWNILGVPYDLGRDREFRGLPIRQCKCLWGVWI